MRKVAAHFTHIAVGAQLLVTNSIRWTVPNRGELFKACEAK